MSGVVVVVGAAVTGAVVNAQAVFVGLPCGEGGEACGLQVNSAPARRGGAIQPHFSLLGSHWEVAGAIFGIYSMHYGLIKDVQ